MDAKATIKLGDLSRGGRSRMTVKALDHDFVNKEDKVHLFGFYLPKLNETYFYFLTSPHLTADAIVDCLQDLWDKLCPRMPQVSRIVLNLDNGPENSSRRTQFMKRLVEFSEEAQIDLQLAYYPPYHSKYNPIERVWGILEQHWNGSLLDTLETAIEFAKTMTYKGIRPIVTLIKKIYHRGVSLSQKAMKKIEKRLDRLQGLARYFVNIFVDAVEDT